MSTQAVLSEVISIDPAAQPAIMPNTDGTLTWLAGYIREHPEPGIIDMELLDGIEEGWEAIYVALELVGTTYSEEILPLINWWSELQLSAFCDICKGHTATAAEEERAMPCVTALNSLMAAVGPGLTAVFFHPETDDVAMKEMLVRYRIWTRTVCRMIKEAWPEVDSCRLEQLV